MYFQKKLSNITQKYISQINFDASLDSRYQKNTLKINEFIKKLNNIFYLTNDLPIGYFNTIEFIIS